MKKQFKVWQAVIFVLGLVIGSGAFYAATIINSSTHGNPWLSLLVIILGGFIVISLAQCFKEINSGFKGNVFMPIWMRGLVGRPLGTFLAINLAIVATPFVATFMGYLAAQYLIPVFYSSSSAFKNGGINVLGHRDFMFAVATISVMTFSFIHIFSFNFGKWFQIIGTGLKLIPLLGIIVFGVCVSNRSGFWAHPFSFYKNGVVDHTHYGFGVWFKSIALGVVASFFIYDGFYYAMRLGKNIENPKRNVGRVMILSAVALIGFFFTFVYATFQMNINGVINFKSEWMNQALYFMFALSSLVALNATTYTGSRIFQAVQIHKLIPNVINFKKENKNNMPVYSAIALGLLSTIWVITLFSILLFAKSDFFGNLITGMTCVFYLWFGIIALYALINRYTKKIPVTIKVKGIAFWAIFSFTLCIVLTAYKVYSLYNLAPLANGSHPPRIAFWTLVISTGLELVVWGAVEFFWWRHLLEERFSILENKLVKLEEEVLKSDKREQIAK